MKYILALLLLVFVYVNSTLAASASDTRYVIWSGGIELWEDSSESSPAHIKLAYGARIELVHDTGNTVTINNLIGNWLKVRHQDHSGYIFGAYVSQYPAPLVPSIAKYAKLIKIIASKTQHKMVLKGQHQSKESSVTLEGINIQEGFLIARKLFEIPESLKYPPPSSEKDMVIPDPEKPAYVWIRELQIQRNDAGEIVEIRYFRRQEGGGTSAMVKKMEADNIMIGIADFAD